MEHYNPFQQYIEQLENMNHQNYIGRFLYNWFEVFKLYDKWIVFYTPEDQPPEYFGTCHTPQEVIIAVKDIG